MKILLFILLPLFMACPIVYAQTKVPGYGKIDKAELENRECDIDHAADAMVLFDVGEVYCNLNLQSTTGSVVRTSLSRHVRIKILTEKGFDRANIRIKYYSDRNLEDIINIAAQTINL